MDFFTRSCKNISAAVPQALALLHRLALRIVVLGLVLAAGAALANGVDVRKAAVTPVDDGYVLEAEFDVRLTPVLDDALHKGVPLHFVFEFELTRSRWYWTNEKVATVQLPQRLSYNTLTRQYRIGAGSLYQNFTTLKEALDAMSRVRRRLEVDGGALRKDTTYSAVLRLRLDGAQLPKPFQLQTGRNWDVSSEWYRWTVTP